MLQIYVIIVIDILLEKGGTKTAEGTNNVNKWNKMLTFKNNVPFRSCISTFSNIFINNAEDLDIVMLMYNLLEYSSNYSMTSWSLWNYCRHEVNDGVNENNNDDYRVNKEKTAKCKYFEYKTKVIRSTPADDRTLGIDIMVPLKYLINLKNAEVYSNLAANLPIEYVSDGYKTGVTFQINIVKLYHPMDSLSINDGIKSLENLQQGFKRTTSCNRCRPENHHNQN